MSRKDIYAMQTARVLAKLDEGTIPWRKTWKGPAALPKNVVSGKTYRGWNLWTLLMGGFDSPYWLTYKQAKALQGSVKKGERGTPVIFWKPVEKEEIDDAGEKRTKKFLILKYYTVFSLSQTEDVKLPKKIREEIAAQADLVERGEVDAAIRKPLEAAKALSLGYLVREKIEITVGQPAYSPKQDKIRMPDSASFEAAAAYHATLFHEIGHSTGHSDRLARPGVVEQTGFGTDAYADEELVAEFAATFLCSCCGIENEKLIENTAAYIEGWKKRLQDDSRLVVLAAQRAQRAVDFIYGDSSAQEAKAS